MARDAGGDLAGGTLEEWQAAMARACAALLGAGFFAIPGASAPVMGNPFRSAR